MSPDRGLLNSIRRIGRVERRLAAHDEVSPTLDVKDHSEEVEQCIAEGGQCVVGVEQRVEDVERRVEEVEGRVESLEDGKKAGDD